MSNLIIFQCQCNFVILHNCCPQINTGFFFLEKCFFACSLIIIMDTVLLIIIALSTQYLLGMFHICVLVWCDRRRLKKTVTYQSCLFSSLLKFFDKILQLLPLDISITWEHLHPKSMTQHMRRAFISQPKSIFQNHLKWLTIYLSSNLDILTG